MFLSKVYFCEVYPTCVSSKLCKFIWFYRGPSWTKWSLNAQWPPSTEWKSWSVGVGFCIKKPCGFAGKAAYGSSALDNLGWALSPLFPPRKASVPAPSCPLTTLPPRKVHKCIEMHGYMRILCPVWCVSMAKPVGPSHPLDVTETELDCLRTVDTCNNSMILNCLCPRSPSRGTNKSFKASTAVGVNRERPFYRSLLSAVVHYTESWWPELSEEWIYSSGVAQRIEHIHPTHGEWPLKIAALMTFIDFYRLL